MDGGGCRCHEKVGKHANKVIKLSAEVKNANNINFIVVRFFIALKSKKLEIQFFIKADLAFFLKRQEL